MMSTINDIREGELLVFFSVIWWAVEIILILVMVWPTLQFSLFIESSTANYINNDLSL